LNSKLATALKARFAGASETAASIIVILIIVVLTITGIFGAPQIVKDNIVGVLCTVLSITALFIYNIWHSQRQALHHAVSTSASLAELVNSKSPYNVRSTHIGAELNGMIAVAEMWMFRGGSGRWQRSTVLPVLSLETKRDIPYRMLILDPTSDELCGEYAGYRNRHRTDKSISTTTTVRNDVLACIVAAAWYMKRSRILPTVHLAQTYSPLRQDFSDSKAAVTVADPNENGLFIPKSSWYYQSMVDEFNQFRNRSPWINFANVTTEMPDWKDLSSDHVRDILGSVRVNENGGNTRALFEKQHFIEDDLAEICQLVFKGRST
jgi:hypothetical protein